VAVLEEKYTIYEKMMDKLENAILTISEINQNISRMLTAHEEKIDTNTKNDEIIFDKFKRLQDKNSEEHQKVMDKFESLEKVIQTTIKEERKERVDEIIKVNDKIAAITKFRWLIVGGLTAVMVLISHPTIVVDILTPNQSPVNIKEVK
jgi:seryl-tRNA synthetase